jgi:DNA-directed RNA polymerase subunit delta
MINKKPMMEIAFEVVSSRKKPQEFKKIFKEIAETMKMNEQEQERQISHFYTQLCVDGRFVTLGNNTWDLRTRHTFDKVHIDMNEIYNEEEDEALAKEVDKIEESIVIDEEEGTVKVKKDVEPDNDDNQEESKEK